MADDIQSLLARWWYYTVELEPGRFGKGQYPDHVPMLPRIALRNAAVAGADCLDIGAMEGVIPILLKKRGANRVLALDAVPHCLEKLAALKRIHGVDFEFGTVGLMYELSRKIPTVGFDVINLSGLLYHVFSPMHVMAGVRPLLNRNGIIIVSTNVIRRDDYTMEYNAHGRFHGEGNTFWYHSAPALEQMIRLFSLKPVDCLFYSHAAGMPNVVGTGQDTGYMTVVCRAIDPSAAANYDPWIAEVHRTSWEYLGLCDATRAQTQPVSTVAYTKAGWQEPENGIDLLSASHDPRHIVTSVATPNDAHILRLADQF